MILSVIVHLFDALLELIQITRTSDHDTDLEIPYSARTSAPGLLTRVSEP
jgi:hypothetical protein